jgi:uncharacterized protein (DUF488 family)
MRAMAISKGKEPRMIGIGYEGLSVEELINRLRAERVNVLVDVRLTPLSRKRGFSKRGLAEALRAVGIRYVHDRRLGNPKDNRAAYADATTMDGLAARDRFRQLLGEAEGAAGVRELADLVEHESVALLCFEADEAHCHREQVMSAVREARQSLARV